jgi:hypothetical protein
MFRFSTYRRTFASLALALACCATIVPAASAMIPDPDPVPAVTVEGDVGYYTHDVGATASDAGVDTSVIVRPDDRATHGIGAAVQPGDVGYYTHGVGATASDVVAAADDGLVSRPAPADNVADQPAPVSTPGSGFDWSDAGIGIAIGIFAAMLLGGLLLLGRRRHTLAGT